MPSPREKLGEMGEDLAAKYLAGKGMRVIARRVRLKRGEIDIVAEDGDCLVFVEVKTRGSTAMGSAAESVTAEKTRRLSRAVREYLQRNGIADRPMRCDLVAIDAPPGGKPAIDHMPGAICLSE